MNHYNNFPSVGHFLVVCISDEGYWDIYLDGKLEEHVSKHGSMSKEILNVLNIEKWEKQTGLKKEDFKYTVVDICNFAYENDMDYDANEYMGDYAATIALNAKPQQYLISLAEFNNLNYN